MSIEGGGYRLLLVKIFVLVWEAQLSAFGGFVFGYVSRTDGRLDKNKRKRERDGWTRTDGMPKV